MNMHITLIILAFAAFSCQKPVSVADTAKPLLLGADLSYVNEVEDAGAVYRRSGVKVDPYRLFADSGCRVVRLRLWHTPSINAYSGLADVQRSIRRAKAAGMQVLLDFHYSDFWADPGRQDIPAAWKDITDRNILGDSLYGYTYRTLMALHREGLLPEMVQTGNEINGEILQPAGKMPSSTDWSRKAYLLKRALAAVKDAATATGKPIATMLHIAQPENALPWLEAAKGQGLTDFDMVGLSYYPLWSKVSMDNLSARLRAIVTAHGKPVMIVETAYPHTLSNADAAGNILGDAALIPGMPATPQGQLEYLRRLTEAVRTGGGSGVIYWEPAWVSSAAKTPWGTGSHWDNATFFDAGRGNEVLLGMGFYRMR